MDFHTLSRRQLQALCKKNKIPANITNVAMADALAALNQVEGLDDFLNPSEGDVGTPSVNHRTAVRTSTQRKAAIEEAEGSKVKTSIGRVRVVEEVVEQENKDANVPPITPAASRRRATAVSTRRKKEVEMVEEDAGVQGNPKTPAAVAPVSRRRATGRSVCSTKIETPGARGASAYNTRRSVRLLEKDLSKMSLLDTEDTTGLVKIDGDVSLDSSNVSHQVEEDSSGIEKGDSLQMESTVVSEDTLEKNTEYECQSRDLDSDVKLVSVTEIDMLVEPHGPNESGTEKVNCLELEADPNASDEAGSESLPVIEESSDSSELETQNNFPVEASEDAFPEVTTGQDIAAVTVVVPDDVSVDVTHEKVAASLPMQSECIVDDKVSYEGDIKEDKNNEPREEDEPYDSNLKLEGSFDTCDKSDDTDAPMEVAHQDTVVVADDVFDQDVAGTLPMSPVNDALKEFVECNTDDDQGINKGDDSQDINNETEHLNLADGNMADEDYQHPLNDDEKAADERDSMTGSEGVFELESISHSAAIEVCTESSSPDVKAEENASENLEAVAQAVEYEEPVAGEDVMLEDGNAFSSPQIPLVHQQVSVESVGNYIVSCPLEAELSCKSNTMVDGDVVSEDNAITSKEEPPLSMDSMTEDSIQEQLKVDVHNTKMMKENVTSDDLGIKSIRELKRILKKLTLNEKSKSKTNDVKDVEKKRTALQVLPQN